jgi:hypothetical protein
MSAVKKILAACRLSMLVLCLAGVGIAADWPYIQTLGPFVCRADFPLQDIGPFLDELSQLQNELAQTLDIPRSRETIQIYIFHDRQTYDRYLKIHFPNMPFRRAVYIKGHGPGMVFAFRSPQFEIDLRHECTHALLHSALKNVPLWLDEGLAVYFELPVQRRAADNPRLGDIRWNVWLGKVPNLKNLEKCTEITQLGKAEYRDCWAWVCFMLNGSDEARNELLRYLRDRQTQNPPNLLSDRLQSRIPDLQNNFAKFFKTWKNK